MFRLLYSSTFEKNLKKLDHSEQIKVEKILYQIKERGDKVGDPLSGLPFLREKRLNGKRLYFLVYKNLEVILVLGTSDKKAQRETINAIVINLEYYEHHVMETLRKTGLL